jgi:hypothetical protein
MRPECPWGVLTPNSLELLGTRSQPVKTLSLFPFDRARDPGFSYYHGAFSESGYTYCRSDGRSTGNPCPNRAFRPAAPEPGS